MTEEKLIQPNPGDQKIIETIQDLLGVTLEQVTEIEWNTQGYVVNEAGAVVGLGFWVCGIDKEHLQTLAGTLVSLTNLTQLNLNYNQLTDISVLKDLTKLTQLDLSGNGLTDISVLKGLTNLTVLYLHGNQLTELSGLKKLTNLTQLDVNNNEVTDLSELKDLTKLTQLNLNYNQLTDISVLKDLTKLTQLNLNYNQLTDISVLKDLTKLTQLDLSGNGLTDISVLKGLTNLMELSLGGNVLTDISVLKGLTNLTQLGLSENPLDDLSVLKELTKLTQLDLGGNSLTDISVLEDLTNLTELSLWRNELTDLSVLKDLTNLTRLILHQNRIKELPEWITELGMEIYCDSKFHETGIDLQDNPLETPPVEIVKQGRDAIRRYYADRKKTGTQLINEVKVLLVGDGGAGKTCLVKRVVYDTYNPKEKKTHGIYIDHWPIRIKQRAITVHFWDFGGQGIMQATHQMFFSVRSLYILVVNARQEADPEDWFKSIASYGGESPILVVINKIDENPFNLNEKDLQRKYPNIQEFFHISCQTGRGVGIFRKQIKRHLARVKMLESGWPVNRAEVRGALEKLDKDYIDYGRYQRICRKHRLSDEESQQDLLSTLNDLGVITYFSHPGLKHRQVLKPDWVTGAIYRIINSRRLKEQKGIMPRAELEYVLNEERLEDEENHPQRKRYNPEERDYIVGLMEQFELCYVVSQDGCEKVIVPDLLVVNESDYHLKGPIVVRFRLEYDFLPRSVLGRFMVKQQCDLDIEESWRTGAVLHSSLHKTDAVVKADYGKRRIDIEVAGEQARDHFAAIRDTLWSINNDLRLKPSEWVPLPGFEEAVEYEELRGHLLDHRDEYYNGKLRKTFPVGKLLDGIEKPEERHMKDEKNIHIHVVRDYIETQQKMGDNYGTVVFGGIRVEYNPSYGLDRQEFTDMCNALMQLTPAHQGQMAEALKPLPQAQTPEAKRSLGETIRSVMGKIGIGAAGKLTADAVVELIRRVGPHIPWIAALLSQARQA